MRTATVQSAAARHDGSHFDEVVLQKNNVGSAQSVSSKQSSEMTTPPSSAGFGGGHAVSAKPRQTSAARTPRRFTAAMSSSILVREEKARHSTDGSPGCQAVERREVGIPQGLLRTAPKPA
ncbi:MAG: hypothetical protein ACYC8T_38000, partial [Myxococcaceae bacterium]